MYADNDGAIDTAEHERYQKKMKHIALHYHYIRDLIKKGQVEMRWIPGEEMIADGLTKALGITKFREFFKFLGLKSAKELEATIGKKLGVAESDF